MYLLPVFYGYFLLIFKGNDKVLCVNLIGKLYTKFFHYQCEHDTGGFVMPQPWGVVYLLLPIGSKVLFKLVMGNLSNLGKPIHYLPDFNLYKYIIY